MNLYMRCTASSSSQKHAYVKGQQGTVAAIRMQPDTNDQYSRNPTTEQQQKRNFTSLDLPPETN
jgi:hypothetical protein